MHITLVRLLSPLDYNRLPPVKKDNYRERVSCRFVTYRDHRSDLVVVDQILIAAVYFAHGRVVGVKD